jgi:SAM-dependent methyltransferase
MRTDAAAQQQEAAGACPAVNSEYLAAVWLILGRACQGRPARVALFGAGRHTREWLRAAGELPGPDVAIIVDDHAVSDQTLAGISVVRPSLLDEFDLDAVLISSDAHESAIAHRHPGLIRLYGRGDQPRPTLPDELAWVGLRPWRDIHWLLCNESERGDWSLPTRQTGRKWLHEARYLRALPYVAQKRVLEIGCGTGWGTAMLARKGRAARVLGIDVCPQCVDYASRYHGQQAKFIAASALNLPAANHSFDVICYFEVIEHLPDGVAFFKECQRVLTPGGLLIFSTPNKWPPTTFHINNYDYPRLCTELSCCFEAIRFENQNSGIDRPTNHGQPSGFGATTPNNAGLAECFFIVARARQDTGSPGAGSGRTR